MTGIEGKAYADFNLTITGTEHHTWQGILEAEGQQYHFRSEIEMLRATQRQLCADCDTKTEEVCL